MDKKKEKRKAGGGVVVDMASSHCGVQMVRQVSRDTQNECDG